jgi:polysaccharide export outer membrane protein
MKDAMGTSDAVHYVIGPEDTLQVTVWKEPTLSGTFPVRPDGMISLVLVGDLPAAGRTPTQLGGDITTKLTKYLQDPSVTVVVLAANSQRIYLMGEVGHVGPVPLAAGMSPLQAIAAAGGLSPFANSKKIYILRGEASKQQKIPFNYKQALKGDNMQNLKLQPGDTIVVP